MPDLIDVCLPHDQTEGTQSHVRAWLRSVGDRVTENEPLLEIETDKVTVEVPAPCTGVLHEILKGADAEVAPGEVLGRIQSGAVGTATSTDASAPRQTRATQVTQSAVRGTASATPARPSASPADATAPSPAVLRLLAEHRLSAAEVAGSGLGGRITVDDVLRHVTSDAAPSGRAAPAGATRSDAKVADPAQPDAPAAKLVTHSRMRRQIAAHMVESLLRTAPHVTTLFEVDLGAVLAHRAQARAAFESRGTPLTITAYFLAACVDALRAVPELNARWTPDALEVYERIDIGIATALEDGGLVVPVIRDVAALDLAGIARELADRVARARSGQLQPADVRGGTFSISNHGVSGSLLAAPIVINQPQSGILGIGKVEKRPAVVEERGREVIAIRPRCYVTLTIDHRVLDGQRANQFLRVLAQRLEHWEP
jgi:2-oxoglutarate dehydrogenase E2 component (dihydrolipoamide succinyltransferase)